jgi:CopG family nickel-responsive transcriptional regulator
MQRVTVTLDDDLMTELDELISSRGYQNRSEAIRDLARAGMHQTSLGAASDQQCVAALVYVYDHEVRELAKRLTHAFHDNHDIALATLHVPWITIAAWRLRS